MAQNISIHTGQRMTQLLVLIILIITTLLFSMPAEAQRGDPGNKSIKTRQLSSKSNSKKACYVLYKKRTSLRNRPVLASARTSRKSKYKPMAETDQPSGVTASDE
jgi:hypothetical protein